MAQVLHGSATTTAAIRRALQNSEESLRALAGRYMGLIGAFAPQGRTFHAVCKYFAIQRKWASVSKRRDCPIIQRARG